MHRISNGTQVASLPTPAAVIGTPGFATKGVVGVSPASTIDNDDFNTHQEELCGVIEGAGLTLNKLNNAQLLQALRMMFRGQTIVGLSTTQTWIVPANVYRIKVQLWGAGGGGGGVAGNAQSSGGAGGGYCEGVYAVTPGQAISVGVGAGGLGGAGTGANGTAGGATYFGSYCTATGGGFGYGSTSGGQNTTSPAGIGAGGNVNGTGSSGSGSVANGGGAGGSSTYGMGGAPAGSFGGTGTAGLAPGAGGGGTAGSSGGYAGGAGGVGAVILEF